MRWFSIVLNIMSELVLLLVFLFLLSNYVLYMVSEVDDKWGRNVQSVLLAAVLFLVSVVLIRFAAFLLKHWLIVS